jgi:threonine synthase
MAGVSTVVFVPARAPANKVAQLQYFGARVIQVNGSYDDAFDLCKAVCKARGWANRSTGLNPFTREGKKTVSFEICCQMGFRVPDVVVVPTGDGNILSGVYKGFLELMLAGVSDHMPRLLAIQSSSSNALMQAWERCQRGTPAPDALMAVSSSSVADSICVDLPRDGLAALEAVSRTQGDIMEVADREILSAMADIPARTGIFVEPAAAAGIAGLRAWVCGQQTETLSDLQVVCLLTGNGLKDPQAATSLLPVPLRVPADPDEVLRLL